MLLHAIYSAKLRLLNRFCSNFEITRLLCSQKMFGEKLENRGLIKVIGKDTLDFLQGLITNDIRHLIDGSETSVRLPCIYSMMLNVQGRLLHDMILYKVKENSITEDCLLLECDITATEDIVKHFARHKLRRKVDLKVINEATVNVLFHMNGTSDTTEVTRKVENDKRAVFISRDPRLPELGHRVILEKNCNLRDIINDIVISEESESNYRGLRYMLGVGEGISEHPPGECFPLECNGDYLHGVSFTKGCYLGQELTSRIHHTGVVRKRIMPIRFLTAVQYKDIQQNCPIVTETDRNVGKFRSCGPVDGIALLRIEEALAAKSLSLKGFGQISTHKPTWWPQGT